MVLNPLRRATGLQTKDGITAAYANWFLRAHKINKKPQQNTQLENNHFLCVVTVARIIVEEGTR